MKNHQLLMTGDGSHTLIVPDLKETYHSIHGAIRESNHVFIQEGLQYVESQISTGELKIFEVGFGTGLNALLTALYSQKHHLNIIYETIESFPLEMEVIKQLNYASMLESQSASDIFRKMHEAKWNTLVPLSEFFQLRKIKERIQQYTMSNGYDICYFDAFAPSKQPEMWEMAVLEKIFAAMNTGAVFVTYCAQGQLKRNLKEIGFEVSTLEGPPGKKEMVRGIKI